MRRIRVTVVDHVPFPGVRMPRRYGGRHGGRSDAKMALHPMLDECLARWSLSPDGAADHPHQHLLPVRQAGMPVMLKLATEAEERRGGESMIWWGGDGAARVLAHAGDALLMERAMGERSLVEMAQNDRDDEASRIICAVASDCTRRAIVDPRRHSCL